MPWSDKQNAYFHAAAAGKATTGKLSPGKAKELLEHSKTTKQRESLEGAMRT
jgi:hypothetical protein